ncbi:MarR family transcriptional regulator [Arthrobacter sp. I2-34]|uniref:MarR family transcriptional regulator n=1 Tax=Arthrobacter hankyongi TaxID=2904801 RepID=A0ABS9L8K5_9MICC|nr:helix-turn-helix domain-containing protein [Arthrobacter hankyongi]MCG2623011.1 MarR family transcriptional regulator [Arthrobacter hankyongi]
MLPDTQVNGASDPENPATTWAALAPLLAGQPRVRLSRDGGRSYPQKHERDLTAALPSVPAAVRIFGKDGTCAAICLDFDSSLAGPDWVEADVRAIQSWLHRCGARWIEDYSPSGGRHLYVPLERRATFTEARDLVEALGARHRSLDKTPHQNLLHGCIRTPGSRHKRGGHQQLAMSLSLAYDVARRPNSYAVWTAMTADLADEIAAVRDLRLEQEYRPALPADPDPAELGNNGRMSRAMQRLAVSGMYEAGRYGSDSEARQGVITGAAAAGLSLLEVDRRMKQGLWPGLASFYARYPARHRMPALRRDWNNAVRHLRQHAGEAPRKKDVNKYPTSQLPSQARVGQGSENTMTDENEHRFIRTWRNALALAEKRYGDTRAGLARKMVLRSLGEAAHKSASRFVEFGVRSLAVATGLDHTTVSSHLRALRAEPDPLLVLIEAGRGTRGDLYQLQIPEQLREHSEAAAWRRGKLHALRPVFRELGLPAAFVYEALEHSPTSLSTAELMRITGLSRPAVAQALESMAAWNLVQRDDNWSVVAATSLRAVAELLGVLEAVAEQLARYRAERAAWREWLARHVVVSPLLPSPDDDYPWENFEGPPDEWTLSDMSFGLAG